MQLRQELNSIRQRDMSVTDYNTKVKEICDSLGFINVTVDADEKVQIWLGAVVQMYGPIRMVICTWEKPPSFFYLQLMLMVEENHANGWRPHGRGGRGQSARNGGG
mgnify:FL=1